MELDREELSPGVRDAEDVSPFRRPSCPVEPQAIEQDLVVGHSYGHVDQPALEAWRNGNAPRVDRGIEAESEVVPRCGARAGVGREKGKAHRLTAVVAEPERAQDVERRGVVAQIRPAKTGRLKAVPLEDTDRALDGLPLPALIQHGVVAVHEAVKGDLDASLGVAPQKIRMPRKDAGGGRQGRPDPETRRDRVVAVETAGHRGRRRAETRYHCRRAGDGPGGTAAVEAHREAHISPCASTFSRARARASRARARARGKSRSTISTYRLPW